MNAFLLAAVVGSGIMAQRLAGHDGATFGLLLTIFGCAARTPAALPYGVGLYIVAAYWFTASTSFANPAVTMARALSDTFAGIAPAGVPAFVAAQIRGCSPRSLLGADSGRCRRHCPQSREPEVSGYLSGDKTIFRSSLSA